MKFLHPDAAAAIEALRPLACTSGLILPWPHHIDHLANRHARLQRLAGLFSQTNTVSPQAWRRTHGVEMARVGARRGIRVAQAALDHEDERTTRASYVDIEPELILTLPRLAVSPPPAASGDLLDWF
jgi:integrase